MNKEFREDASEYRTESAYRKCYSQAKRFYDSGIFNNTLNELEEIKKERIKLQTLNLERKRIDRNESRRQLYFEQIGKACTALPLPAFSSLHKNDQEEEISYLCCISDTHYGACFKSLNNEYSPEIFADRLQRLLYHLEDFIHQHNLANLHIANLGDSIQGILRISDIKTNDSSVVRAVVEFSHYIAAFLNELSCFAVIDYYHVPTSNHTQTRPLGTKSSELSDEDMEYIISHYIQDLCRSNPRIHVHLAEEGKHHLELDLLGNSISMMHGHQVKDVNNCFASIKGFMNNYMDYLIMGHFHSGRNIPAFQDVSYDSEVLICPSFVGSDPYSDSLMKGSHSAVHIYGFSFPYGHTETYKYILT